MLWVSFWGKPLRASDQRESRLVAVRNSDCGNVFGSNNKQPSFSLPKRQSASTTERLSYPSPLGLRPK